MLEFKLSGVDKDEETRAKIKALDEEIYAIGQEFDRNIRESVLVMELDSVDQLAGLPQDYIDAHPPNEAGKIEINTTYADLFPFMDYAEDDDLRRELFSLFNNRAYPENEEVLMRLLEKRYELARLLGFENYAQRITADKMVGNPERVETFLEELTSYTEEAQQAEYDVLLARLREINPEAQSVEGWQRRYLTEKVVTEQFEVDSKLVREYFNFNDTREGMLTMVQDLFGVQFKPWDTTVWHESVTAHEMWDGDQLIGRFYLDMHPRDGKYQHAAVFPRRTGIAGVQAPVATLVCNFPEGNDLMQHNQVVSFLHEFGHLIHNLFAGHHRWDNVSGIKTEWDFVEAPSQMLQEWVWDYDTISPFARNSEDEPIPRELLDRMIAARDFGLGLGTRRQLSYAALSMGVYNRSPEGLDIKSLQDDIQKRYTAFEPAADDHFFASIDHLNGYSALYYTYQWSLAIATDMFTRFENEGLRNVETAGEYRDMVLAQGGAKPAAELVTDFLGREISFKPYADRLSGAGKERIETQTSGGQ
jgi:thimet oligopeptidase